MLNRSIFCRRAVIHRSMRSCPLFCGNLHQVCQQYAHNDTDGGRKQRACQRISGFGNARRHKINRHRVKTGFCAAHQNRRDASCQRIGPVGFENIEHQSSRRGRRKQAVKMSGKNSGNIPLMELSAAYFCSSFPGRSSSPEPRRIPTAIISPMSVGTMPTTVFRPSLRRL